MSINWAMDKYVIVYSYSEILYSNKVDYLEIFINTQINLTNSKQKHCVVENA